MSDLRLPRAAMATLCIAWSIISVVLAGEEAKGEPEFSGDIVIGATFPISGALDYYGQSAYYGASERVRMANAAGGVNGKRLVLEWRDNQSDSALAVEQATEFIDELKVSVVLGPLMSDSAIAMRELAEDRQVVFVSPLATSDAVREGGGWVFRACYTNTAQSESMAKYQTRNLGARSCAVLFDPRYQFSSELSRVFERAFRKEGGKVVGMMSIVNYHGNKDYVTPLKRLTAYSPDFIYVPCYGQEATELIHAARDAGIPVRFAGPVTWDNELVFTASGRRLAGTAMSSMLFERGYDYAPFQEFYRTLEEAGMDEPDTMAASAYDAVSLIIEGLKNGESSEEIREGIMKVKRLPLATGVASMDEDGNLTKPVIIRFVEQKAGRMVPVLGEMYEQE